MIKIGITGGIGSGKSVVSCLLEVMGVPVYISDTEAKRLTTENEEIRRQLTNLLGDEVYLGRELNKPFLAAYLFADPQHAQKVNNIIHPIVKEDFRQWVNRHASSSLVAMESAILIEAGFANEVDHIVMVYAPLEIRIERAMKRDAADKASILKRIQNQMNDEEKKEKCGFTICNDENTPLIPQLERLLEHLKSL